MAEYIDDDDDDLNVVDPEGHWVKEIVDGDTKYVWYDYADDVETATKSAADDMHDYVTQAINDSVNHPSHYTHGPVEVLDIIKYVLEANDGLTPYEGALLGMAIKYQGRFTLKGNPIQDIDKAIFYLNKLKGEIKGDEK